jgi:WD40 repeat protein
VIRHLLGSQHHSPITCLACAPHDPWLVAVGFQSGHILLVDVRDGRVRHRLGGHDDEVHALAWRPQPIGRFDFVLCDCLMDIRVDSQSDVVFY